MLFVFLHKELDFPSLHRVESDLSQKSASFSFSAEFDSAEPALRSFSEVGFV